MLFIMTKHYGQACPVAKTLELVGERWTLLVVRDLLQGPRRFQDLQQSLKAIAPNILSSRIKVLEEHQLVVRSFYSQHPPRAKYELTDKGRELGWVVGALAVWGSRHLQHDSPLKHSECGRAVEVMFYCPQCRERLSGGAVTLPRSMP